MTLVQRPYIVLNYAVSVDGKISTDRRDPVRFSSRKDRSLLDEIRAQADAVLIGGGTLRAEDPPARIQSAKRRDERVKTGKPPHPVSIVLSRTMRMPSKGRYFSDQQVERIIVTPEGTPGEMFVPFQDKAELIQVGQNSVDLPALCAILYDRGIHRMVVEGGGEVNMALFEAGLVDEVYMTLCPVIIGGRNAPTPADGTGFPAERLANLALVESRQVGQELFLRYRVERDA